MHIPVVALNCKTIDCTHPSHVVEVNTFYGNVISAIVSADTEAFAKVRDGRRGQAYNRPGWSDYVDELYKSARECFLLLRDTGKPRQGQVFNMMQQSRARFIYAIRAVKQRENALRRVPLAKKMTNNSNCAFWKEIKKMNNVNTPLPNCIAGVLGGSNIAELWREQFSELLNYISDTTDGIDSHCCYTDEMVVSVNEVNEGISRLECNKACGLDGVSAEHLKHCSSRVTPLLAMCITGFMVHGFFLPESIMFVVLIPIIKDKKAKISSTLYRQL